MFTKTIYAVFVTLVSTLTAIFMAYVMTSKGLTVSVTEIFTDNKMLTVMLAILLALLALFPFNIKKEMTLVEKLKLVFVVPVIVPVVMVAFNVVFTVAILETEAHVMFSKALLASSIIGVLIGYMFTFSITGFDEKPEEA
tara:strand:- start:535 stop:954 length:420 start_codon:yes stop_codon:yes gene_type:complete